MTKPLPIRWSICAECGETFQLLRTDAQTCSIRCRVRRHRRMRRQALVRRLTIADVATHVEALAADG